MTKLGSVAGNGAQVAARANGGRMLRDALLGTTALVGVTLASPAAAQTAYPAGGGTVTTNGSVTNNAGANGGVQVTSATSTVINNVTINNTSGAPTADAIRISRTSFSGSGDGVQFTGTNTLTAATGGSAFSLSSTGGNNTGVGFSGTLNATGLNGIVISTNGNLFHSGDATFNLTAQSAGFGSGLLWTVGQGIFDNSLTGAFNASGFQTGANLSAATGIYFTTGVGGLISATQTGIRAQVTAAAAAITLNNGSAIAIGNGGGTGIAAVSAGGAISVTTQAGATIDGGAAGITLSGATGASATTLTVGAAIGGSTAPTARGIDINTSGGDRFSNIIAINANVTSGSYGIYTAGNVGVTVASGVSVAGGAAGVSINGTSTLDNRGTVRSTAGGLAAVDVRTSDVAINNSGLITGDTGVGYISGLTLTNAAGGVITGTGGTAIKARSPNNTVASNISLLAGSRVNGNILLSAGNDTLNIYGSEEGPNGTFLNQALLVGTVDMGGGTNTLALRGPGILGGSSTVNISTITNLTRLEKLDAGSWGLSGVGNYAGGTTISGGLLYALNAGSLGTGAVDIASGGGLVIQAAGTVGNSMSGFGILYAYPTNAGGLTFSGVLSGGLTLATSTAANGGAATTIVLSNDANNRLGNTSIAADTTLQGTALSLRSGAVSNDGVLSFTGASGSFAAPISGTGRVVAGLNTGSTLTLTRANGYSGGTTINSGSTLALTNAGAVGSGAVVDNGTLAFTGASGTFSNAVSGSGGITVAGVGAGNTLTFGGTLGNTVTITDASAVAFNAAVSRIVSAAAGSTIEVGANGSIQDSGGGTAIAGPGGSGTLRIVNRGTIASTFSDTFANPGLTTIVNAGTISNTVNQAARAGNGGSIVNAFSGNLTGGSSTSFGIGANVGTGGTIANYGTISGSATLANSVGTLFAGSGSSVSLFAGSTTGTILTGANSTLTIYNGTGTGFAGVTDAGTGIVLQQAGTHAAAAFGATRLGSGSTLVLRGTGDGTAANGAAGSLDAGAITGASTLTKQDTGTWVLTGAGSFGTVQNLTGRLVALDSNAAFGSGTIQTATGAITEFRNTQAITDQATGSPALFINRGTFTGGGTLLFNTVAGGRTSVGNGGNASIALSQGGLIDIQGAGYFEAGTNLEGSWASNLGSLNIGTGAEFRTGSAQVRVDALNGTGRLFLQDAAGSTFTLGVAGGGGTFNGAMSGDLGFTKVGTGTQTLTGANTFTGTTTISAGTLALAGTGTLATSAIVNNAAFDIAGHTGGASVLNYTGTGTTALGANTLTVTQANGTYSGVLSGTGGFVKGGSGTYVLTGANLHSGGTSVSGGTLQANAVSLGTGPTSLAGGSTLQFINTAAQTYNGAISGAGAVSLAGSTNVRLGGSVSTQGQLSVGTNAELTIVGQRSGATNSAVDLSGAGAALSVLATGSIQGGQYFGVRASGTNATIANVGSITNTGTGGDNGYGAAIGVTATSGRTIITNGAINSAAATISGQNAGINHIGSGGIVATGLLTVNNYGSITGNLYNAIENQAGAGALTVNNYAGGAIVGRGNAGGGNGIGMGGTTALTLTNAGTIVGRTNGVSSGGVVSITNSGTIGVGTYAGTTFTANTNGSGINVASGTITNSGLISGGNAIAFNQAGATSTITNTSAGVISGTQAGRRVVTSAGTLILTNSGQITATTPPAGNLTAAIVADGANSVITNEVSGAISGGRGVELSRGGTIDNYGQVTGTVDNALSLFGGGTITNHAGGTLTANSAGAWGMYAGQNADNSISVSTLINNGTINADAGMVTDRSNATITNTGLITAQDAGIWGYSGPAISVTNSGTINSSGNGVRLSAGGTIDNTGSIISAGQAIQVTAGSASVTNGGTIRSNGQNAIDLAAGGTVTNNAGATIFASDTGVQSLGALTLTNNGSITGGGNTGFAIAGSGNFADSVTLGATSTTFGGISLGDGDDSVVLNTGANVTNTIAGGTGTNSFTAQGTGTTSLAASVTGFQTLNKNGTGLLVLIGRNTGFQTVAVNQGMLAVVGGAAIDDTATVAVASGATFSVGDSETIGALTGAGTVSLLMNTLTLADTGANTFAGVMTGTGGFTKIGTGTFVLTGANTFTGATDIQAGTLRFGANDVLSDSTALTVRSGATLDLNGFSDTVGSFTLYGTLTGGGLLTSNSASLFGGTLGMALGGTAVTQFSGTTTLSAAVMGDVIRSNNLVVAGGTLQLGASNQIADTTAVTINAAGTLDLGGFSDTVGSLTSAGTLNGSGTLNAATFTLQGGTINANLGNVAGANGGLGSTVFQNGGTTTLNGTVAAAQVQVNGGTLVLGAADRIADTTNLSIGTSGTFDLQGFGETVQAAEINGTLNGIGTLTAGSYMLDGAIVNANLGAGTLAVTPYTGRASVLNGTSAADLVSIQGGTLALGASNRLADTADVQIGANFFDGTLGRLNLGAFDDTVGSLLVTGGATLAGTGTLTAATYTLQDATIDANLGAGTLIQQSGAGRLNGTAAAGIVAVQGGSLTLGGNDRLAGTAAITIANGATLDLGGFGQTSTAVLDNGGTLANGTLALNGAALTNRASGIVTAAIAGNGATIANAAGGVIVNQAGVVDSGAGARIENAGVIGAGSLANGVVTFDGAGDGITFLAGGTIINAATGVIGSGGASGIYSPGGAIAIDNAGTIGGLNYAAYLRNTQVRLTNRAGGTMGTINLASADALITNAGTITSQTGPAILGAEQQALTVLNQAGGTISSGLYGVYLSGAGTIVNDGTISGSAAAIYGDNANADRVTLNAGSVTAGLIYLGGGDDQLTIDQRAQVGAIDLGTGTNVLDLVGSGTGAQGGTLAAGVMGVTTLNKLGTGDWTLADVMATTVNAGIGAGSAGNLTLTGTGAIGDININGATLTLASTTAAGSATIHMIDPTVNFAAAGTYANAIDLAVAANQAADPSIFNNVSGGAVVLSGALTQSVAGQYVTFTGPASFELTNAGNAWTGVTRIDGGTTLIGTTASLSGGSFVDNGTLIFRQAAAGTSARAIGGSGTVVVDGGGANTALTGAITVAGGVRIGAGTIATLANVSGATADAVRLTGSGATLNVAAGGTVTATGGSTVASNVADTRVLNAGTLDGGAAHTAVSFQSATGTDTLFNAGTIRGVNGVESAATLMLGNTGTILGTAIGVRAAGAGSMIANTGTIAATSAAGRGVVMTSGTLVNLAGGTISGTGAAIALAGTGNMLALMAGSTVNGTIDASATTGAANVYTLGGALNGGFVGGSGDDLVTLTNNAVVSGTLDGAAGNDTLALVDGGTLNAAQIVNFENGSKNGLGTWTLTGTTAASPLAWAINGGTLAVSGGNAIADTAVVTLANAGRLALNANETIGGLSGFGSVALGANTLTTGGANANLTFAGVIAGSGGLTKLGTGTLTLSGANTYTGATLVAAGTLALGASNVLADAGALTVASGATLDLGANNETVAMLSLAGTLNGTGTLTAAGYLLDGATVNANLGDGILVQRSGSSTLNGTSGANAVAVAGGTLALGASNRLRDSADVAISGGATFDLRNSSDTVNLFTLGGTLAGTGTLTAGSYLLDAGTASANLGTGTLVQRSGNSVLNGTSAASVVVVSAGTLTLGASNRLSDTADVSVSTGATLNLAGNSDTVGVARLAGTLAGTGTLIASQYQLNGAAVAANLGAGALFQLGGTSTLTGTAAATQVSIQAGTLVLGANERLADGATVLVNGGATLDASGRTETIGTLLNGANGGGTVATGTGGRLVIGGTNADFGFGGTFTGTGDIDKVGSGTFTYAPASGATTARLNALAGTTLFAGTTAGAVRVAGGSFTGAGTIGGNLSLSSGTLSPGTTSQPIAALQASSLTVSGGSVVFDLAGSAGGFASDQIRVSGAASLTGGTVTTRALEANASYRVVQFYNVLQAGSLTGTFANGASLSAVSNDANLQWRLRYDLVPNSVLVELRRQIDFASGLPGGGTANQQAVAAALNNSAFTASDNYAAALNLIASGSAAQRAATFNAISGEAISDITTGSMIAAGGFASLLQQRAGGGADFGATGAAGDDQARLHQGALEKIRAAAGTDGSVALAGDDAGNGVSVWLAGYGADGTLEGRNGRAGLSQFYAGVGIGGDARFGKLTVGLGVAANRVENAVDARTSRSDGTLYQGGGYVAYDDGATFANVVGSYFQGDIASRRTVVVTGSVVGVASGEAENRGYTVGGTIGHRVDFGQGFRLTPQVSVGATGVKRDAFSETGAGVLSLTVGAEQRDQYQAEGQLKLSHRTVTTYGLFEPFVSAGVRRSWGDRDAISAMRFTGAPVGAGNFTIQGAELPKWVGLLGGGFDARVANKAWVGISAESTLSDRQTEGRLNLRFKLGF